MDWCFLWNLLVQGKEEVESFLVSLHGQEDLSFLVLVERVVWVQGGGSIEVADGLMDIILVMLGYTKV